MTTLARSRLSLSTLVWMACIVAGSLAACTQDFGRYHFLPDDAGVSGGTTGTGGAAGASATGGSTSSGGSGSGGASAGTAGNAGAR